jgi:CRP/FNR family cyclic AMP-dependent transcriptional regulator
MTFDLATFLENAGVGRKIVHMQPKQVFFLQGKPADSIFYLRTGSARLTVVSHNGKEATIALLPAGEFVGEESLASVGALHMATASAITACKALRIAREEMIRVMHEGAFLLRNVYEVFAGTEYASAGRIYVAWRFPVPPL